jgi:hypothetical protein
VRVMVCITIARDSARRSPTLTASTEGTGSGTATEPCENGTQPVSSDLTGSMLRHAVRPLGAESEFGSDTAGQLQTTRLEVCRAGATHETLPSQPQPLTRYEQSASAPGTGAA